MWGGIAPGEKGRAVLASCREPWRAGRGRAGRGGAGLGLGPGRARPNCHGASPAGRAGRGRAGGRWEAAGRPPGGHQEASGRPPGGQKKWHKIDGFYSGNAGDKIAGRVGPGRVGSGRAGSGRKREFVTDPLPNAPRKKIRRSGEPLTPIYTCIYISIYI